MSKIFIAKFELENTQHNYIYENSFDGWRTFHSDTFSPEIENQGILILSISGKTYTEKKGNARDLAIEWSNNYAGLDWSYGELAEVYTFFEKVGKRYGLLKEFKENGIC